MTPELSRQVGRIMGLSIPGPTLDEREEIIDALADADTMEELPDEIVALLGRLQAGRPNEPRANPNHDKSNGQFAKGSGAGVIDYKAISPGNGNTAASATASINKTAEGKRLVTITKKWQGQSGEVTKIQEDFMTRANGKTTKSAQRDAQMDVIMKGIKHSPTNEHTLYRGAKYTKDSNIPGMKGKSFVIPPSSFSTDERISRQFVDRSQSKSITVIYKVAPHKGRALPVELYGDPKYAYEKEHISAGQFTVRNVTKLPGNKGYIIDVDHTAMFDWEG